MGMAARFQTLLHANASTSKVLSMLCANLIIKENVIITRSIELCANTKQAIAELQQDNIDI